MSSSRRNSKQISTEEESTLQAVKSPDTKLKIKLKLPEHGDLSESDVKKMFVAIEENDVKTMKHFLTQRNVSPDALFETNIFEDSAFTWSALHAAAYYGSKQVISLLMEHNANVELKDTWYQGRPLAWAAFGGHLDAAKMLIEKYGADKKAQNEQGQVALELVYELTPEWEKMFAETKSGKSSSNASSQSSAKDFKPAKPKKDDKDSAKGSHKDSKGKDNKGGKGGAATPANAHVGAFTDLYKLILGHKDKTGRELADIFVALPSKDEYPEYYEIIKSPMSLQLILARIKSGHYKSVDDFDREFQLVFENALIFNEDTSRINKDARVLLKLFNTKKKDIYASYKLVENPKASHIDKSDRRKVATHTKGALNFRAGEFVQLNDPLKTLLLIERLEVDSKNNKFIIGSKFLRPEQTLQVPGQTFYEKEVLKISGEFEYDFAMVDHKVYVQAHKDYVRGLVLDYDPKDVYVCENRYSETGKSAFLIKDWKRVYSVEPLPTPIRPYPSPLKLPKFSVASSVIGDSSHGRRASSTSHTDSNKKPKRSRPNPKKQKSNKRRASQSDDSDEDDDDDDEEDSDVDVEGVTSPALSSQRRRSSQTQRSQQASHSQKYPQTYAVAHPHPSATQSQRGRRVSSTLSSPTLQHHPNMALQQQQQQQQQQQHQQQQLLYQQQQQQQQHIMYQQQQVLQHQQMPHPHQQVSLPQSPSSQSMGSPGSPNRAAMAGQMVDPRTGMMVPRDMSLFVPAEVSTIYDPNVGVRKGYAMLQSIAVDAEDKSFVMSLGTENFAHSLAVQHHVHNITLIPLLATQLAPIQPQVGMSVFQNGRKLSPTGLVALPSSPNIGHHVYTIALVPGQNTIDVWVSAQAGGLFQGGPPGGKTETQQFFVFIQRNGAY